MKSRSPPPSPPLSRQDEFARHGFREGYPLWNPDPVLLTPDRQNKGLEIGDIGIINEDGCFNTVLNLYRSHPELPVNREPNIYVSEAFETGHVFSSPEASWNAVEREAPYYTGPNIVNHGRMITRYLSCLSEDGAHIIVPQGAKFFKLGPQDKSVLDSLAADPQHRASWFNSAGICLGSRPSTLYVITGLCQSQSWSLASFNRRNDSEVQVSCELVEEDGKLQLGRAGSNWAPRGRFAYKIGPQIERQGNNNQTIFIQSISITHKDDKQPARQAQITDPVTRGNAMRRRGATVQISNRGTGNHQPVPSSRHTGRSKGANSTAMMLATEGTAVIQHIPKSSPAFHPSEIINQYLLAKQRSASAAVTHDSLWITMLEKGQLSKLQDLETSLDALVTEHYLIILNDGVVYLTNNISSLRRFGIESPVDVTDCFKQDYEVPYSRHVLGDIYHGILHTPRQTIKVETLIIKMRETRKKSLRAQGKRKEVKRMVEVWSKLDHTNILPLIWTMEVHARLSVVFPRTENGTLTSYLDRKYKYLSEGQILTLINDVASGLHYLHSKGNLHSGLSGSNIVVDWHRTALLSVFGYMTPLDEEVTPLFSHTEWETDAVRWAAPESLGLWITNRPLPRVLTKQSNIYSLGGIILQILSGMVPYHHYRRNEDLASIIHIMRGPERPDAPLLTDHRWEFIKQCWSPSESRPSLTEVLEFCKRELSNVTGPPIGIQSASSGKPLVDKPSAGTIPTSLESGLPSGIFTPHWPSETRVSGLSSLSMIRQAPANPPLSGLPVVRLSGTPFIRVDSASLTPGGSSTTRLSGPPVRVGSAKPLPSERRSPDVSLKGKNQ